MQNMFSESNDKSEGDDKKPFTMPNAEHLHDHINSMMGGKLGKLAMELAEETAEDLNLDIEGEGDAKEVFQKLMKNPAKMMNMVKNIGSKIDEKIKSGEIKESELMQEGMELLNKMKDMPGMADMQKMFTQMGIPGLGKGAKINMGAMEAQLNRNMKNAKMKERMRSKAESNLKNKDQQQSFDTNNSRPAISEEEILKIFSTGEVVEKTPRGTKPPVNKSTENKKKKKGKK
jgi:urease gamma subunit